MLACAAAPALADSVPAVPKDSVPAVPKDSVPAVPKDSVPAVPKAVRVGGATLTRNPAAFGTFFLFMEGIVR